jgi:hypothetical protein
MARCDEPCQSAEERRLSRSIGANDNRERSRLDGDIDSGKRSACSETYVEILRA